MSERSLRIVATFERDADLLGAIRAARGQGFRVHDVFAPYVVHGVEEALDAPPSRLAWVTLAGGLLGLLGAALFQFWAADVDWPLNVGGKPESSGLAFLPIAFEVTVLLAGLATAAAFFWRSRLGPGPLRLAAPGVTDDVLALALEVDGGSERETGLRELLAQAGAAHVRELREESA